MQVSVVSGWIPSAEDADAPRVEQAPGSHAESEKGNQEELEEASQKNLQTTRGETSLRSADGTMRLNCIQLYMLYNTDKTMT